MPRKPYRYTSINMSQPIEAYLYLIINALAFGNDFAFRCSVGPIWDVLEDEFGSNSSGISFLSSSYWMTVALTNIPWGLFLQIYLPEWGTMICLVTMTIVSLLFPLVTLTSYPLIFGCIIRAVAGLSTDQVWLCAITMGSHRFGNKSVGLISAFMLVLGTAQSVLFGYLQALFFEQYQDWKSIFYVISATSLLYAVLLLIVKWREAGGFAGIRFRRTPKTLSNQTSTCPTSKTANVAGSATSIHDTSTAEHGSDGTTEDISTREAENMKLPLWEQTKLNLKQAAKSPLNWMLGVTGCCAGIIFFGVFQLWFIPFLMVKYEYSRTLSSIVVGVALSGCGIGVISYGEIIRRFGPRKPMMYCAIGMFAFLIILVYVPTLPLSVVIVLSIVIGGGVGILIPVFTLVREYNWYHGSAETATALINTLTASGGFIGQYAIGALLDVSYEGRDEGNTTDEGSREYTARDYQFAFSVAPAVVLLLFILTLFLKETNGKNLTYDDDAGTDKAGEQRISKEQEQRNIEREESV